MVNKIFGDLEVKRNVTALRSNQGLRSDTISATDVLTQWSAWWQLLENNTSDLEVTLPAETAIDNGWTVVVQNESTSTYELDVTDPTSGLIKSVPIGKAYQFTMIADNTWNVASLDMNTSAPAARYKQDFTATSTTDWVDNTTTYDLIVTAATHASGTTPIVSLFELEGTNTWVATFAETIVSTIGNIDIKVPVTPNCRFAGRILVM